MTSQIFSQPTNDTEPVLNRSEQVVDALHTLGGSGNSQFVPLLIEVLQTTHDPLIRNAAAIGLGDLGDRQALHPIVGLLKDPKTEGYRGTLIYALEQLDCASVLADLVNLVIQGDFEVSHQAFSVIQAIEGDIDRTLLAQAIQTVQTALLSVDSAKKDLLDDLAQLLDEISEDLAVAS